MELLPPPEAVFESAEEAESYAQEWAKKQGYAVTTRKSKYREMVDGRSLQTRYLKCVKGGVFRGDIDEEDKKKERVSRLTDCPFSAAIRRQNKSQNYLFTIEEPTHNHDPIPPIAFHQHRKLTEAGHQLIDHLTQAKSRPCEIISSLRLTNSTQLLLAQDIYNEQKRIKLENLAGRTPIEAMHHFLQQGDWFIGYKTHISGELTHLFFAHPRSIELFKRYSEVVLMDCTYKTNRFKLPLLVFVGATGTDRSFYLAFAFISRETEDDYLWVLQELKNVIFAERISFPYTFVMDRELALMNAVGKEFPDAKRILCEWHITMMVEVEHTNRANPTNRAEMLLYCLQRHYNDTTAYIAV